MRKKVFSSILLSILLTVNLVTPIAQARNLTSTTETPTTQVEPTTEKQTAPTTQESKEVDFKLLSQADQSAVLGANLVLTVKDTSEKVDEWTASADQKKLNLTVGTVYQIKVTPDSSYQAIDGLTVQVDAEGKVSVLQEDGSWQAQENPGSLEVQLTPIIEDFPTPDTTTTTEQTTEEAAKKTLTVTMPKVNVYKSSDPTVNNIGASFKLIQEDNSSEIATWGSKDSPPKVELGIGLVYLLKMIDIDRTYATPAVTKIRMKADGKFELLNVESNQWELVEQFDIAVSAFSRSAFRVGSNTPLSPPTAVSDTMIAPINRLQIIKNMPTSSKVELISIGTHNRYAYANPYSDNGNNEIWGGAWEPHLNQVISGEAPGHNGLTVEFKPSDIWANGYQTNPDAGWNANDLKLSTTSMWVKVRYTDAAYYDGQLVDAEATIKVTPFKNRTDRSQQHQNGGYGYWGNTTYADNLNDRPIYYPTIQISGLLWGGWVWQNVKEFDVDLSFFAKGSSTPITLKGGLFTDTEATFYTINSLNPQYNYGDGAAHGPEYVLPKPGTYAGAYKTSNSNISEIYKGDDNAQGQEYSQYAYNGGDTNRWSDDDDHSYSPNWSKNSAMFTTTDTTRLSFTMGNLMRKPGKRPLDFPSLEWDKHPSTVYRTNYIWTTISTTSFTNNKVTNKDIFVKKDWVGYNNPQNNIIIELWATWKQNGVQKEEFRQQQTLGPTNNWQSQFKQVPDEASMLKIIQKQHPGQTITDFKYKTVEKNLPDGYKVTYSGDSTSSQGFTVTNTQLNAGLVITKKWSDNGTPIANQGTSAFGKIKVTLKRKVGETVDNSFSQVVELAYNSNTATSWKTTVNNLPIKDASDKNYTYFIEEDISTIPNNFYIKGYPKNNIQLKYNTNENQLEVENERQQSKLTIRKRWFKQDGETELKNGNLPKSLKVKLFQTSNGQTSGGTLVKEITLNRQGTEGNYTWTADEFVPIRDKTGKIFYTYYIEEEHLQGYLEISDKNETFVTFSSSMIATSKTLTVKNKVNPTYPTTGGFGILPYLMFGFFTLLMASILYNMQKRKGI